MAIASFRVINGDVDASIGSVPGVWSFRTDQHEVWTQAGRDHPVLRPSRCCSVVTIDTCFTRTRHVQK